MLEIGEFQECNLMRSNISLLGHWSSESPSDLHCSEAIQKPPPAGKISKTSDCEVCHQIQLHVACNDSTFTIAIRQSGANSALNQDFCSAVRV